MEIINESAVVTASINDITPAICQLIRTIQFGHGLSQIEQKQVDALLLLAQALNLSING